MRDIKYLVIHCAATKPSMTVDVDRVRRWHLDRGWSDIGYHFYIRQNGMLEIGRPVEISGAHVKGYNSNSIGICYEGGLDEDGEPFDTRTCEQKRALMSLLVTLKAYHPKAIIQGHRDFPRVSKACPSFDAKNEYKEL